jgi:hypothetical protein
MTRTGTDQMRELARSHRSQQRRQELTAAGMALGLPVVIGAEAALISYAVGAGMASGLFMLPAACAGWYFFGNMRRWQSGIRGHVAAIKQHIHYNLFDRDLWRDLLEDASEREVKLGSVTVATVPVSFGQRLTKLFDDYEKLCARRSLPPFPDSYVALLKDPKYSQEVASNLWKYALAQILDDEFPPQSRRGKAWINA